MMPIDRRTLLAVAGTVVLAGLTAPAHGAQTTLSDVPLFSASTVPANVMLALSVEYPTGQVPAYIGTNDFDAARTYLGYFDEKKCYDYNAAGGYFQPTGASSGSRCVNRWSGNLLNWVTMTGLDNFRKALTGGNRIVDNNGLTVLQRSRVGARAGGVIPIKVIPNATNFAPNAFVSGPGTLYFRSGYADNSEIVVGSDRGVFLETSPAANFSTSLNRFYVRVKVCDAGAGLESNCARYPNGNYKPVGTIQRNADRLRVGAAAYVFRDGFTQPNGTIRSILRDVGPTKYNGLAPRSDNPNKEWNADSGIFVANPDPASASASGMQNSGTINYLNKFGYTSGYIGGDVLSEIYWAALAHLMQVPLPSNFGVNAGATAQYDGFPALATTIKDPLEYSCQSNAIVVIGDNHTHCDAAVPGSGVALQSYCTNHNALAVTQGLNTAAELNVLGNLPLIEANSGNGYSPTAPVYLKGPYRSLGSHLTNGGTSATYNVAGLAYFAHTKDIRPADNTSATRGKQTVDTYVVDVLEPGPASGATDAQAHFDPVNFDVSGRNPGPSQYWLAAKYGGFDDVNDDGIPANYRTWHLNTSSGKNTVPDNWFAGNQPDKIQSGMNAIFDRISSRKALAAAGAGTSATRSLRNVDLSVYAVGSANGFVVYSPSYKPGDWTGDVTGSLATLAADGTVSPVTSGGAPVRWSAQSRLETLTQTPNGSTAGWDTARRIVTKGASGGVAFRYANLSGAQKTALRGDATLVDYLRGDRRNEFVKFRTRRAALGDIVGSEAVLAQGAQSPNYSETDNPGYGAFRTALANRPPVIYVGANDGMLHAFDGRFSAPTAANNNVDGGGAELFAYVPGFTFDGPNGTPDVDGLAALSNLSGVTANVFSHRFYVDQTPHVADVDFNRVAGNAAGTTGAPDWRTLLVGALGKGGKGIYALDVTTVPDPPRLGTSAAQEAQIKNKVLWEFTDPDMGYYYGEPVVAKTRKHGWVVLVTTGYNNASGVGKLFVLNARTGELLETLATTAGSPADPSGLARPAAYTKMFSDNTIEQVYAGDLGGNVWRFDLSSASGTYPSPMRLAQLTAPDGTAQPITTAPRVEIDRDSTRQDTRRWVFFGTGQFLEVSDLQTAQRQTMYALRDGTGDLPSCADSTAIPNVCVANANTLPLARGQLTANTNLVAGVTIADGTAGWYYDLPGQSGAGGATERVIFDPDSQAGIPMIAWATLTPTTDPCNYDGAIYAVDYGSGKSVLLDAGGNSVGSIVSTTGTPTKVTIAELPNGEIGLLVSTLTGKPRMQGLDQSALAAGLARTNWREVFD
ncbi:MAG TPA: PilC/PilY family type IV pilus protein [Tahibacter sp.]|nr:PilC/PilY family type IV pilus protein [Tahibacter sp.]